MRLVPYDSIQIAPNRQRREFEPKSLLELQESISNLGLMHPVVVRNGNHLVAGERRLRAMQEIWALEGGFHCHRQLIPPGMVPCIDLGDLDPIQSMEAELDENIKRKDLTWQEHVAAISKLMELRRALNPDFKTADLAEELTGRRDGMYHNDTAVSLIVAKHLSNPEVAGAKDQKEAFKILVRQEEARRSSELGAAVGKVFSAADHTLLLGDCLEWMRDHPVAVFDVICTDPPYGMGADDFGDSGGRNLDGHSYVDDPASFRTLMMQAASGFDRVAKPAAHLYVCCDIDQFLWLKTLFSEIGGWNVFRTPLINYKSGSGRVPLPEHGPRRQYEIILYAYRGGKRTRAIYSDVLLTHGDENLGHGAQKPVGLYSELLKRSCQSGERVLDPFAGTGTIFPAAHELKIAATGIEKKLAYYGIAVKRLEALK